MTGQGSEESRILAAFAQGDPGAVNALAEQYYRPMLDYLLRYGLSLTDAEDAVQESFIKAARSLRKGSRPANLKAWLFTICRNTMRDLFRKAWRRREISFEAAAGERAHASTSPEERTLRLERAEMVRLALLGLSPAHREVIILRFYHDFSLQEIAAIIGKSPGTVKSRLHYGVQRLKEEISDENNEEFNGGDADV